MKSFIQNLRTMVGDVRRELPGHFQAGDVWAGVPDLLLAIPLLAAFTGLVFEASYGTWLSEYFQFWFAWEILAVVSFPSFIWIFEKRGEGDPRSVDVPRPIRVAMCAVPLIVWAGMNPKSFVHVFLHAAPFLGARCISLFFNQPIYRDFIKACRRLGFMLLFFVLVAIPYQFFWLALGLKEMAFGGLYGAMFFGGCYFLFFCVVEILAWSVRRLLDLDKEDKIHAF